MLLCSWYKHFLCCNLNGTEAEEQDKCQKTIFQFCYIHYLLEKFEDSTKFVCRLEREGHLTTSVR